MSDTRMKRPRPSAADFWPIAYGHTQTTTAEGDPSSASQGVGQSSANGTASRRNQRDGNSRGVNLSGNAISSTRRDELQTTTRKRANEEPQAANKRNTVPSRSGAGLQRSTAFQRSANSRNDSDDAMDGTHRMTRREQVFVQIPADAMIENEHHLVIGEDGVSTAYDGNNKPVRTLTDFAFFQSVSRTLVPLDGQDVKNLSAYGIVGPLFIDEVAAANHEEAEEESLDRQTIFLPKVLRFTINYVEHHDPMFIETKSAWYLLQAPSQQYLSLYQPFYKQLKICQAVISEGLRSRAVSLTNIWTSELYRNYQDHILLDVFNKSDLINTMSFISAAIESLGDTIDMSLSSALQIIAKNKQSGHYHLSVGHSRPPIRREMRITNLDQDVLKPENQNPVCVTPFIGELAKLGFPNLQTQPLTEGLQRVRRVDGKVETQLVREPEAQDALQILLDKAKGDLAMVDFHHPLIKNKARFQRGPATYATSVAIDDQIYELGDVIMQPAGTDDRIPAPELPDYVESSAIPGVYFWFGKILSIKMNNKTAHVQWFHHGCQSIIGELANPQELFLTTYCGNVDLRHVIGKATVYKYHVGTRPRKFRHDEYFYGLLYNHPDGSFLDIKPEDEIHSFLPPQYSPEKCPLCAHTQQKIDESTSEHILGPQSSLVGFTLNQVAYHVHDMVLFFSHSGPCNIGQITSIAEVTSNQQVDPFKITVNVLKYAMGLMDEGFKASSMDVYQDQHLILTDQVMEIGSCDLIGKCYILHKGSIKDLDAWLSFSPHHFFISKSVSLGHNTSWSSVTDLSSEDFMLCKPCMEKRIAEVQRMSRFYNELTQLPLRVFDPFAGVGAFGAGLALAFPGDCVKMTHAIEISPSTAKTLKENSPSTIVYNQCANLVLQHAIELSTGHDSHLKTILGTDIPPPPTPQDIDCIVAGFPCQPHSHLNMYQKADDVKSDLMLNVLSWVDHLKPAYCIFENVKGFLNFRLQATQATRHKVEGGIDRGGLKFLIRALVTLGYQVRFGLLQAGQYGVPQSRIRFFLLAAKHGNPLPNLPQPTHEFPEKKVAIKMSYTNISPIMTLSGSAVHNFVSIRDAIDDLRLWDWKNPEKLYKKNQYAEYTCHERLHKEITTIQCSREDPEDPRDPWCGLEGFHDGLSYEHSPHTPFQAHCQKHNVTDLQHITQCRKAEVVERVCNIKFEPHADYKCLNSLPRLQEWQTFDSSSANARDGYQNGYYGRLDADSYFRTIVTNVEPTAKQSWILHPWCRRVYSIRELARAQGFPDDFQFYTDPPNIKIMHRQIGNAVPWPLAEALGRELRTALFERWKVLQNIK